MKATISKNNFLKSIDSLPEEISVDLLIDRNLLLQKIEHRIKDGDKGNIILEKEMAAGLVDGWNKKFRNR